MKKILKVCCLLLISNSLYAKTTLYGEANAYAQIKASDAGTALQLSGHNTEFGFQGDNVLGDGKEVFFDVTLGANLIENYDVYVKRGTIGFRGQYGELSIFNGDSPLSNTNHFLKLMSHDPDQLAAAFAYSNMSLVGLEVGVKSVEGVYYRSPKLTETIQIDAALIPAQIEGGETGLSLSGNFVGDKTALSAAFEINGEFANTQIVRLIGERAFGKLKVGASFQVSGNSELNTNGQSLIGFLKIPMTIGAYPSRMKWLVAFNNTSNAVDESEQQIYTSFVQELTLTQSVSGFAFVEVEWQNDLADTLSYSGLGMKIKF